MGEKTRLHLLQTIMLLLGGFAIASAFTKHFIAKRMATWVLARVSSRPAAVLIANMFVATFASMWITNVAAPVLCFSVLDPILRTLPAGHPFGKSLVLGEPCLLSPIHVPAPVPPLDWGSCRLLRPFWF